MIDCVGIVRFSVLSTVKNKFKAWKHQAFSEYAEIILDDERMTERFRLFENICLPSFDAQADTNFSLLVVAPRLLSKKWRERLDFLCRDRQYLDVYYADEEGFLMSSLSSVVKNILDESVDIFSTFRIDDDDAVSYLFIKKLREYHKKHFIDYGVSFSGGYYLDVSSDSDKVSLTRRDIKNTGAGLALISSTQEPKTVFTYSDGHLNYHKLRPVILDGRHVSFVVMNHEHNDTKSKRHRGDYSLSVSQAEAILNKEGISIDLRRLFDERRPLNVKREPVRSIDMAVKNGQSIPLYWWDDRKNFGDLLGPWLVGLMTGRQPINVRGLGREVVGLATAGSLVHSLDRPGVDIWGSGAIRPFGKKLMMKLRDRRPARIHAVRGHLTLKQVRKMGWDAQKVLGDPALIVPRFYSPNNHSNSNGKIGIVPHYAHKQIFKTFVSDERFSVIDVQDEPAEVIDRISSCSSVLSSSLHGLICAHAFGIPWVWLRIPELGLRGEEFKFEDFFTVLDREAVSEYVFGGLDIDPERLEVLGKKATSPRNKFAFDYLVDSFPFDYGKA